MLCTTNQRQHTERIVSSTPPSSAPEETTTGELRLN
jgi:hypothetical protein